LRGWGCRVRAGLRGPGFGGASAGEDALAVDLVGGGEVGEGLVESSGRDVAVQEIEELAAGESVAGVAPRAA
jgi:hypothetical protein